MSAFHRRDADSRSSIAIDSRMLFRAGIGRYLEQLLPRIIGSSPELHFSLLVAPSDRVKAADLCSAPNVQIVDCDAPVYSLREQLALIRAIPKGTDLFWAPHYPIPLLYPGRLVVTVHDVSHLALPEMFGGLHKRLYARGMFSAVRARADQIIVVSAFTSREFQRLVGRPRGDLSVIHNGVDDEWFNTAEPEPSGQPYFLFVGNVKPHKNLSTLISAFRASTEQLPHRLVIVGQREGFITGDDEALRLAGVLEDRVQFTGALKDAELRRWVAGATALVFPSVYEGFGLPPLEAMAAGCPVITSNAASMPEVCGDVVRYFEPHDQQQLANELLRAARHEVTEQDRQRARERARSFSWEDAAVETARILRETLRS